MINHPYIIAKKKQIRNLLSKLSTLKTVTAREKTIQKLNELMKDLKRMNRQTERRPIAYVASRTVQTRNTKIN
tara:strand:- start:4566 stop:4784 length:219 start_codon:yes stop_codon:yes gene_type:complete